MVVQENAPLSSTKTTQNSEARSAREVLEESYLALVRVFSSSSAERFTKSD